LNTEKFFSNIIKSIFKVIFIDTKETLADCQCFTERIRVIPYLRYIIANGIDIIYPKTSLKYLTRPDKVEYIIRFKESNNYIYQCLVKINNIKVITIGGYLTKEEAIIRIADSIVKLISRTKSQATTSS
ncbi:hypothetical protein BKA64DRAFT_564077, partial [Cadophora sp. MPI-SDFR-AT-0126]